MNISQNINKLLYALSLKGQIYKINSFQFYSEKNDKYSTKYQILKKTKTSVYNTETSKIEEVEKFKLKLETYSQVELLKYFMKEYKGMG